jgi:putative ABC transport system ATP-binding protein
MRVVVEQLRKIYPLAGGVGLVTALDGIDLTLESGRFYQLHGPSGSGKTSLLAIVATLARPTAGIVRYDGLAFPEPGAISCGFQEPVFIPELTVLENLHLPASRGRPLPEGRDERLLEEFGLGGVFDSIPAALSGGEKRRLDLARALLLPSRLLLLDEPTAYLDKVWSKRVMELVLAETQLRGTTLLVASHEPLPMPEGAHIILMERGKVVDHGNH